MRETDLLLGRFADTALGGLAPPLLDAYERLIEEADADLLAWIAGPGPVPAEHAAILAEIRSAAQDFAKNLRSSS